MGNVLVVGPQCTGSKAVARMLIECGGGLFPGQTYLRATDPGLVGAPTVMHCSFPQGDTWYTMRHLVDKCRAEKVVVCVRSFLPHLRSMVGTDEYGGHPAGHHPDMIQAEGVARRAYGEIFTQLAEVVMPFRVVTYRELAEEPRARAELAWWCAVDGDAARDWEFLEGNTKWYDD